MAAVKLLANQLKKLNQEPVEGIAVEVPDENNLFEWRFYIEGPKDSPYEGGVFQALMHFPPEYPMAPPTLRIASEFWHPNVYPDGRVCISILHSPIADETSGELPEERWLPTQSPITVMLSVISMLNDPNFSSPANVDASVECRNHADAYRRRIRRLVEKANREVPPRIKIPHPDTDPEERRRALDRMKQHQLAESVSFDEAEAVFDDDMQGDDDDIEEMDDDDDMDASEPEEEEPEDDEDDEDDDPKGKGKGKAKNATAGAGSKGKETEEKKRVPEKVPEKSKVKA